MSKRDICARLKRELREKEVTTSAVQKGDEYKIKRLSSSTGNEEGNI